MFVFEVPQTDLCATIGQLAFQYHYRLSAPGLPFYFLAPGALEAGSVYAARCLNVGKHALVFFIFLGSSPDRMVVLLWHANDRLLFHSGVMSGMPDSTAPWTVSTRRVKKT